MPRDTQIIEKLHSKKTIYSLLIVFLILDICICIALSWNEMRIKKIDISSIPEITAEDGVLINLDNAYYRENDYENYKELFINGWAVIRGKEANPVEIRIALINETTGENYLLPTSIIKRPDVTEAIGDGLNYDYSGFSVHLIFDLMDFDFTKDNYRVLVLYTVAGEQFILKSGTYTYIDKNSRGD